MMQVFHSLAEASKDLESSIVAIGNFDGFHLGHRSLIKAMVKYAKSQNTKASVLTFYPHPVEVLNPTKPLQRLTTTSEKLSLIEGLGVDLVLVEKFNLDLARLTPEEFFKKYLVDGLSAKAVHVGFNFYFGKDRSGDTRVLGELCAKFGIHLEVAKPFEEQGVKVSSSAIRRLLEDGDVVGAAQYLGRPYSLAGQVVRGDHRGRELGFPTANLKVPSEKILPKSGVYVTCAAWQKQRFSSVTNVGVRPTFQSSPAGQTVEAHLLDFGQELYDEFVELEFVERIRDEKKFESAEALKSQIAEDIKTARRSTRL